MTKNCRVEGSDIVSASRGHEWKNLRFTGLQSYLRLKLRHHTARFLRCKDDQQLKINAYFLHTCARSSSIIDLKSFEWLALHYLIIFMIILNYIWMLSIKKHVSCSELMKWTWCRPFWDSNDLVPSAGDTLLLQSMELKNVTWQNIMSSQYTGLCILWT